jgi:carboxypeptidase Taq
VETTGDQDPHGDTVATIRELHRDWIRDCKLPDELVEKTAEARIRGQQSWDAARKADDFSSFRDTLSRLIELKREAGERLAEATDLAPYEALLDEYEPGARVADLQNVFGDLRQSLVELIARIGDAPNQPNVSILQQTFNIDQQRRFSRMVAQQIGFDFQRGRLDETSHPFCTTLGPSDCRILTRFESNWLPSGIFGTMHEAGHGMYEQGLRGDWFGTPPGSYSSLGIHESQSRLWENQVGRSLSFWQWLYPQAQQAFTPNLDQTSLDDFHFAINAVRPNLIRVEADEASYNLHIIIRFDLERELIEGSLSVDDLPEAWNDRYEKDLGVRPPTDADGVLQDVHWSAGLFGYFPTYTLGNLVSAQLFDSACRDLGDLDADFLQGNFVPLLNWLRTNVHQYGRCYSGNELVAQATGSSLSAEHLVDYLKSKAAQHYGV